MLFVQGRVTRWVADEPQPGVVALEITDADRRVHRFVEKSAVLDAEGRLHRRARYPIDVPIACRPRHHMYRRSDKRTVNVVDLSPWGVDGEEALYEIERSRLAWAAPAVHSDLSIAARQAVALVTFRRWRERMGLDSDELPALEQHLWAGTRLSPDVFDAWYDSLPDIGVEDEPLPARLRASVAARGIDQERLRDALTALVEITCGGLFGRAESACSLSELATVGRFTADHGVPLEPADAFVENLWIDDAWGRPDESLVRRWRAIGQA